MSDPAAVRAALRRLRGFLAGLGPLVIAVDGDYVGTSRAVAIVDLVAQALDAVTRERDEEREARHEQREIADEIHREDTATIERLTRERDAAATTASELRTAYDAMERECEQVERERDQLREALTTYGAGHLKACAARQWLIGDPPYGLGAPDPQPACSCGLAALLPPEAPTP